MKDYLDEASGCLANARLEFEPVAYPTAGAAMKALRNREVDCVFPCNLSTSDGEGMGVVMTPAMMRTEVYAVVRRADLDTFAQMEQATVAVETDDPNYDAVLMDHFPDWQAAYYPDMQACLQAVADGKADCVLISNYQYNNLSALAENRWEHVSVATGIAVYDPQADRALSDTFRRADQQMYQNKRLRKEDKT